MAAGPGETGFDVLTVLVAEIASAKRWGQVPKYDIFIKCCISVPDPIDVHIPGCSATCQWGLNSSPFGATNAGPSGPGYLLHEGVAHFLTLGDVVFGDFSGNVSDAADISGSFRDTDCLAGVEQVKGV